MPKFIDEEGAKMTDYLISRKAAIELVDWYQHEFIECDYAFGELSNELSKLPSAQPERKKGKWIDPAAVDVYRCSICEEYTKLEVPRLFYHYCPNCGAEMEGGEDG